MTQEILNFLSNKDNSPFFNCNKSINFDSCPELNFSISKNNLFSKDSISNFNCSDNESLSNTLFPLKDFCLKKDDSDFNNIDEKNEKNGKISNSNNINKNSFEKNRNYFNNNLLELNNNKEEPIKEDLDINLNKINYKK